MFSLPLIQEGQLSSFGEIKCAHVLTALDMALTGWLGRKTIKNTDALQTNSEDPDETAHNEPSHRDLHCNSVIDFWLKPLFVTMDVSKFRDGGVNFKNSGVKGFMGIFVNVEFAFCFSVPIPTVRRYYIHRVWDLFNIFLCTDPESWSRLCRFREDWIQPPPSPS